MEEHLELTILGLLVAVTALSIVARAVRVPYPIVLVLGGLALGFVPDVGEMTLDPDLVLLIFLPPLLYSAAFFANPRELRNNIRPIGLLAVGLVFVTTGAVAVVAHELAGLPWGVAFVLGAVVSPTDAVAPAQIVRRFGVPRRVVTVIEGENLTNDWTALTLYRFAVTAVVTGAFSWAWAAPRFLLTGLGGVVVGLAAGHLIRWVRKRVADPSTSITISLFSGFAAYIPAEQLGLSGVIAAVTVGLYLGWYSAELTTPETRMQSQGAWEVLTFLLNAVLFVLVGLQFPRLASDLHGETAGELVVWAVAVSGAVIVVRLAWVFGLAHVLPRLVPRWYEDQPEPPWRVTLLLGWCSMRGAVALAAALAIPHTIDGGGPFPHRDLVIFLTYTVILATLVLQGLTLGPLIKVLRLRSDGLDEQEEALARMRATEAGLARIDELLADGSVSPETAERTRALRDFRRRRFEARIDGDGSIDERSRRYQDFMHQVIAAERDALVAMRNAGEITDDVRRTVERDLDLEEARLS